MFLLLDKLKLFESFKIYRSPAQTPSPELLKNTAKVHYEPNEVVHALR